MAVVCPFCEEPVSGGAAVCGRRRDDQRQRRDEGQSDRAGRRYVNLPQGGWQRTVRVRALGVRRGPASEARLLYEEAAAALRLSAVPSDWIPLLDPGETEE